MAHRKESDMRKTTVIKLGCTLPVLAMLAACATKTQTGAAAGAGGGALVGAGLGALMGGKQGAVIGAGVGAAAGAGTGALIGRYMDKQEQALKEVKSAKVEREGNQLVVKFNSAILFDTGKSILKPASQTDLTEFAKVLKEYKETDLVIEGHTDNTGKKETNKKLSVARADAVISFLESQGVERARLTGKGYADEQPVGDNSTDAGRQANRRVQIQIAANEKLKKEDAANAAPAPTAAK
jgi:outer membrane protein OmpA-like peptidoglycan-associated protein